MYKAFFSLNTYRVGGRSTHALDVYEYSGGDRFEFWPTIITETFHGFPQSLPTKSGMVRLLDR